MSYTMTVTTPLPPPEAEALFNDGLVTGDALTWRWQRSLDGGATWSDLWVIDYARR